MGWTSATKSALKRLFSNKPKTDDLKSFEKQYKKIRRRQERQRKKAKGILSPDQLRKREELTRGGKKALVLKISSKSGRESYTLAELKKMADAIDARRGKYGTQSGVPVVDLFKSSQIRIINRNGKLVGATDYSRISEIKRATLYKFKEDILHFRVSSSGGMRPPYNVRIRLEEWKQEMTAGVSSTYEVSARKVCRGHVSIDCTCGRFQYWFRYLAGIGGFCVTPPLETGFPKIRNPNLRGCACKHILKTLAVMQSPIVYKMVAKEMARQARKKSWITKKVEGFKPDQHISEAELEMLEEVGKEQNAKEVYKKLQQAKRRRSAR